MTRALRFACRGVVPALVLLAGHALAHDTWILPATGSAAPGQSVSLDVTSGMEFPALGSGPSAARVDRAVVRLAGRTSSVAGRRPEKGALQISATLKEPGIATFWVETKPRSIDLKPAEVEEYLEEIGAAEIGREWKAAGSPKWREVYTKHAKTFVRVGEPGDDRSWAEPIGTAGLEIVPEQDPTALRKGGEIRLRLLKAGAPLGGLSVGLVQAGKKKPLVRKTDGEGRVRFPLDENGWALIRATFIVRGPGPGGEWESHFATLTVGTGSR